MSVPGFFDSFDDGDDLFANLDKSKLAEVNRHASVQQRTPRAGIQILFCVICLYCFYKMWRAFFSMSLIREGFIP